MPNQRIVITGVGAISPPGLGRKKCAAGLTGRRRCCGAARLAATQKAHNLTEYTLRRVGASDPKLPLVVGRKNITGKKDDQGAFRTPPLR